MNDEYEEALRALRADMRTVRDARRDARAAARVTNRLYRQARWVLIKHRFRLWFNFPSAFIIGYSKAITLTWRLRRVALIHCRGGFFCWRVLDDESLREVCALMKNAEPSTNPKLTEFWQGARDELRLREMRRRAMEEQRA